MGDRVSTTNNLSAKKQSVFRRILRVLVGKTIPQKLFRAYLLMIILGAILLYLPISLQSWYKDHSYTMVLDNDSKTRGYTFWDSLFVGVSALTNTGLTPAVISETYTNFGQAVMVILMELGGLGLMTVIFLLWNLFKSKKSKVNINQIIILQSERGNEKIGGTYKSLRTSVFFILIVQLIFMFLYSFWLCWMPIFNQVPSTVVDQVNVGDVPTISSLTVDCSTNPNSAYYYVTYGLDSPYITAHHNYPMALWQGLFFSVSCINNAGFDNFSGGISIAALRNDWNTIFQFMCFIQIVLGGIGFPIIYDVLEKIKCKNKGVAHKFTLFTKVAVISYFVVAIISLSCAYAFEYGYTGYQIVNLPLASETIGNVKVYDIAYYQNFAAQFGLPTSVFDKNEFGVATTYNKCFAIFFNTCATRSAGIGTVNNTILSPGTQWLYIVSMFIGGSPSSAAGGIRTTTMAVIVLTLLSKIKGREQVVVFNRGISNKTVQESFLVALTGVILVAVVSIVIFYTLFTDTNDQIPETYSVLQCLYETASAFGTVGFSMGITSYISHAGQILLCIVMFIGQLGINASLLSWTRKEPKGNLIKYPDEELRIG